MTIFQKFYNFLFSPLRLIFLPDEICERLGLTSLQQERLSVVSPYLKGRLLDIGCGNNRLVKIYGNGIGVDIKKWSDDVFVVDDVIHLPFTDVSFETITFVASLNHIPMRAQALKEARRLIKSDGRLIITMIGPILGLIGHAIWWYSEDKQRGGMKKGEVPGLSKRNIVLLCCENGFRLKSHRRFLYGMNNMYIFEPC